MTSKEPKSVSHAGWTLAAAAMAGGVGGFVRRRRAPRNPPPPPPPVTTQSSPGQIADLQQAYGADMAASSASAGAGADHG